MKWHCWVLASIRDVCLTDSIRDVRKYSAQEPDLSVPGAEVTIHMKLFRAQRNFYIALFALFLFVWVQCLCCVSTVSVLCDYSICVVQETGVSMV